MAGCSFCGLSGHGVDTCPDRLEDHFGTPAENYDGEDDEDGGDGE